MNGNWASFRSGRPPGQASSSIPGSLGLPCSKHCGKRQLPLYTDGSHWSLFPQTPYLSQSTPGCMSSHHASLPQIMSTLQRDWSEIKIGNTQQETECKRCETWAIILITLWPCQTEIYNIIKIRRAYVADLDRGIIETWNSRVWVP